MITLLDLSRDELFSLHSLSDLALKEYLTKFPSPIAMAILDQMASTAEMAITAMDGMVAKWPTKRQQEFLDLQCPEVLYGGAAGGGKSEALLMWLAEGVHIPDYSAIIFRRTFQQLIKSNDSLWAKARRMFAPLEPVANKTRWQWYFPSGAMIEMGALEHEDDVENYQGNSYHRIAFDELTHFTYDQYDYLRCNRIRACEDYPISLGIRSATNPGGPGHMWVKSRFITEEAMAAMEGMDPMKPTPKGMVFFPRPDVAFMPARVADNGYIFLQDYLKRMGDHHDPVMRDRMMNGDWKVQPDGKIKEEWLRYFTTRGQMLELRNRKTDAVIAECDERECERFCIIDPAGTGEEEAREKKGKAHSWSVAAVFDRFPHRFGNFILLRHIWRKRVNFPDLMQGIKDVYREWNPGAIKVENEKIGIALVAMMQHEIPISTIATGGKDKLTRALPLLHLMEKGGFWLPKYNADWLPAWESEALSWQGLSEKEEVMDQIDTAAYAAIEASSNNGGVIVMDFDPRGSGGRLSMSGRY